MLDGAGCTVLPLPLLPEPACKVLSGVGIKTWVERDPGLDQEATGCVKR